MSTCDEEVKKGNRGLVVGAIGPCGEMGAPRRKHQIGQHGLLRVDKTIEFYQRKRCYEGTGNNFIKMLRLWVGTCFKYFCSSGRVSSSDFLAIVVTEKQGTEFGPPDLRKVDLIVY